MPFLDQVIKCELLFVDNSESVDMKELLVRSNNKFTIFISHPNYNANLITFQDQIYYQSHNAISFKYECNKTQCQINFLYPIIPKLYIDDKSYIFFCRNNI